MDGCAAGLCQRNRQRIVLGDDLDFLYNAAVDRFFIDHQVASVLIVAAKLVIGSGACLQNFWGILVDVSNVFAVAQEIEREGCIQLSIADDTLIPLVTVSTGHIDIIARIPVDQDSLVPFGRHVLEVMLITGMCTIDIRLIGQALQAALINYRQRRHVRDREAAWIVVRQVVVCTVRDHGGIVHRAYRAAYKRQRTIVMGIHNGAPGIDIVHRIGFCTADRLTCDRVRPSAAFAGRLARTVDVDEQMVFCRFFHHLFDELDGFLILGIKEVRLNALDAHIGPFFKHLLPVCIIGQVCLSCPDNQPDTLFSGIVDQLRHPIVVTFVLMFTGRCIAARLPAFVQKLILPAHFHGKINILFIILQAGSFEGNAIRQLIVAKIAVQPRPVNCTRLDPAGIFYLAFRRKGFGQSIVGNRLQVADHDIAPRACKRQRGFHVVRLLRGKDNAQEAGTIAGHLCTAICTIQVCLVHQSKYIVFCLVEQRHRIPVIELCNRRMLNLYVFVGLAVIHRPGIRAIRQANARMLRRDRQIRAFIAIDAVTERYAIVKHSQDDGIGRAFFFKGKGHLLVRSIDMLDFGAKEVIILRPAGLFDIDKFEATAEVPFAGNNASGRGRDNNGIAIQRGVGCHSICRIIGKQSRNFGGWRRQLIDRAIYWFCSYNDWRIAFYGAAIAQSRRSNDRSNAIGLRRNCILAAFLRNFHHIRIAAGDFVDRKALFILVQRGCLKRCAFAHVQEGLTCGDIYNRVNRLRRCYLNLTDIPVTRGCRPIGQDNRGPIVHRIVFQRNINRCGSFRSLIQQFILALCLCRDNLPPLGIVCVVDVSNRQLCAFHSRRINWHQNGRIGVFRLNPVIFPIAIRNQSPVQRVIVVIPPEVYGCTRVCVSRVNFNACVFQHSKKLILCGRIPLFRGFTFCECRRPNGTYHCESQQ